MKKELCKINILGEMWTIIECDDVNEDENLKKGGSDGYSSWSSKEIVVLDLNNEVYSNIHENNRKEYRDNTIRHEIIHSFLSAAGLQSCAGTYSGAWSLNEEMIDWMAIMLPRITKACYDAGCINLSDVIKYTVSFGQEGLCVGKDAVISNPAEKEKSQD